MSSSLSGGNATITVLTEASRPIAVDGGRKRHVATVLGTDDRQHVGVLPFLPPPKFFPCFPSLHRGPQQNARIENGSEKW